MAGFQEGRGPSHGGQKAHRVAVQRLGEMCQAAARSPTQRLLCEPLARKAAAKGLAWGWEMIFAMTLARRLMACCWTWAWPQRHLGLLQGANEMLGRADGLNTAGPRITSVLFHYNIDEMPWELNSSLYQLAYSKIGFIIYYFA